jgi:hypothetical protein
VPDTLRDKDRRPGRAGNRQYPRAAAHSARPRGPDGHLTWQRPASGFAVPFIWAFPAPGRGYSRSAIISAPAAADDGAVRTNYHEEKGLRDQSLPDTKLGRPSSNTRHQVSDRGGVFGANRSRLARQVIGRWRHQGTPPSSTTVSIAPELPPHPAQQHLPTPALTRPEPVTRRLPAHRPAPHHPGPGPRPAAGRPDTADKIRCGLIRGPECFLRKSRTHLRHVPEKFRITVPNGHSRRWGSIALSVLLLAPVIG